MNKLKVKYSNFETTLSFNEWAKHVRASSKWDANNERNKSFIEKYLNAKFAENYITHTISNKKVI